MLERAECEVEIVGSTRETGLVCNIESRPTLHKGSGVRENSERIITAAESEATCEVEVVGSTKDITLRVR